MTDLREASELTEEPDSFELLLRDAVRAPNIPIEEEAPRVREGVELLDGRFVIERELGRGGMGTVYAAFDRDRDARVALKVVGTTDAKGVHRFKNEFRALQHVAHPNLVRLYELFASDNIWFFTMELIGGAHFLDHVRSDATVSGTRTTLAAALVPPRQAPLVRTQRPQVRALREPALRIALAQLVGGVRAIHRAGRLHRDLKPSNVLVTPRGQVVILDFGLAIDRDGDDERGVIAGTPAYMAPERLTGEATTASDWYSVGVMLFEALTGQLPDGTSAANSLEEAPRDLADLCRSLLEPDPARRPEVDAILDALAVDASATGLTRNLAWLEQKDTPAFVGRERELGVLAEALAASEWGKLVVCHVRGPSGMGKTALFEQAFRAAPRTNVLVLSGRCHEREAIPYKLLDGVVDAVGRELAALPRSMRVVPEKLAALARLFPALARFGELGAGESAARLPSDETEIRRWAVDALREALSLLRTRGSLVIHIDDAQWADVDGSLLLAEALAPPSPPLLLCVSERSGEASSALDALWKSPSVTSGSVFDITLGELTLEEASALVLQRLNGRADIDADALAREASGVPLFAAEIARFALEQPHSPDRPVSLDHAILSRAARLPDDAQRLLELIALAGVPVDRGFLASASDISDVDRPLAFLNTGDFTRVRARSGIEWIETFHDRVREAVVGAMPPERERETHGRIALSLEQREPSDVERLAEHFAAAGENQHAVGYAIRAAERAQAALAFDRAANWFGRALDLGDHPAMERARLQAERGEALAQAGRGLEAAESLTRAAEGGGPWEADRNVELLRRAAEQLLMSGHMEAGLHLSEQVLAATGLRKTRSGLTAVASLALGRLRVKLRGLRYEARPESQISRASLARIDAAWTVASSLGPVDFIRGAEFQVQHVLLALDAGEKKRLLRALCLELPFVAAKGARSDKATRRLLDHVDQLARDNDDPAIEGLLYLCHGLAVYLQGDLARGIDLMYRGVEIHTTQCSGMFWEIATAQRFIIVSLFFLGRLRELSDLVPPLLEEAEGKGNVYSTMCFRSGYSTTAYLAKDDVALAHEQLARSRVEWTTSFFRVPHFHLLIAATHIDLYTGEPEAALARIRQAWPEIQKAQLLRIAVFRVQMMQFLGQSLVVAAEYAQAHAQPIRAREFLAEARSIARKLAKQAIARAAPLAWLLEASVDSAERQSRAAQQNLRRCIRECDEQGLRGFGAAARVRLGQMLPQAAEDWLDTGLGTLRAEGIVDPTRMVAMLAPGFSRP